MRYKTLGIALHLLLLSSFFFNSHLLAQKASKKQLLKDSLFSSFDGTKIYYEVKGSGNPVILLHGFINTSANWKSTPLYEQLLKSGFQVITLDLRGNGKSDHPHNLAAYQQDAEAKDVIALVQSLGFAQYDVVGYSRGAIIAARLLVLDKHVRRGVLGGMGTGFTDPEWPRRKLFYKAFSGEGEIPQEAKGAVDYARSIGADLVALAQMQGAQPSTSPKELHRIRKPVLVIAGDKDTDNGSPTDLATMLGNASYKSIPEGGHNDTAKLPSFANVVVDFLKKQ